MRICLIVNPTAGQSRPGSVLPRVLELLANGAPEVVVRETQRRGDAEAFARAVLEGEFDLVVAAGGDGTINEVLNGLGEHTPLGILPLGTANVLARELRIPVGDLAAACAVLREYAPHPIDLGWCNGRRFALMAGIGFDAQAVREVPPNIKDVIGAPAYVLSALRAFSTLTRPIRYRLCIGRRRIARRGMMLVVANAASYAGSLQIAPDASIDDGLLDLCLFRERSRFAFLAQIVRVIFRRHRQDPLLEFRQARAVEVRCKPPAAVQLDGDFFGCTPVEIRVLPAAVRIIRPL